MWPTSSQCCFLGGIAAASFMAADAYSVNQVISSANVPTSSNSSATFEVANSNLTWSLVTANTTNQSLTDGLIGWRIAGDDQSYVVLNYTSTNDISQYYGNVDGLVNLQVTASTTYGAADKAVSSEDEWTPVPITRTLWIHNLYCSAHQNFTALVALSNGTTIRKTLIDDLSVSIPDNTDNVTVADIDLAGIVNTTDVIYYGRNALYARYGPSSNVATLSVTSEAVLMVCTDDD